MSTAKIYFEPQLLFEAVAGSGERRDVVIDDIIVLDDICPPEGKLSLQCCVCFVCACVCVCARVRVRVCVCVCV